jgi:hypothetical protein
MKKLLIAVLLVCGMAGLASATVMHYPVVEEGDPELPGHGFHPDDPLQESETVYIDIMYDDLTNGNAYLNGTGMLELVIVGNAEWVGNQDYTYYAPFDPAYPRKPGGRYDEVVDPKTLLIGGSTYPDYTLYVPDGGLLFDHIGIHCTGPGPVIITLTPWTVPSTIGVPQYENQTDYLLYQDLEATGGSITIYQVPEPMTMGLLSLGGLALLRRRR